MSCGGEDSSRRRDKGGGRKALGNSSGGFLKWGIPMSPWVNTKMFSVNGMESLNLVTESFILIYIPRTSEHHSYVTNYVMG